MDSRPSATERCRWFANRPMNRWECSVHGGEIGGSILDLRRWCDAAMPKPTDPGALCKNCGAVWSAHGSRWSEYCCRDARCCDDGCECEGFNPRLFMGKEFSASSELAAYDRAMKGE